MEALGRVELPTNGLGNRCSIHLSYRADAMLPHYLTQIFVVSPASIGSRIQYPIEMKARTTTVRACK